MEYRVIRNDDELMHYGVKGMKWGVRRSASQLGHKTMAKIYEINEKTYRKSNPALAKMNASAAKRHRTISNNIKTGNVTARRSSKTTNQVLDDYANMNDKEFANKYSTTKKTYRKRVEKYGDPYLYATTGKKLVGSALEKNKSRVSDLDNEHSKNKGKKIVDNLLFGTLPDDVRTKRRPWDEKSSGRQPWDEKPSKKRQNI